MKRDEQRAFTWHQVEREPALTVRTNAQESPEKSAHASTQKFLHLPIIKNSPRCRKHGPSDGRCLMRKLPCLTC